jgi:hypothetical protein
MALLGGPVRSGSHQPEALLRELGIGRRQQQAAQNDQNKTAKKCSLNL